MKTDDIIESIFYLANILSNGMTLLNFYKGLVNDIATKNGMLPT